jgi:Bacteriophage Mu Gp45 spike protein
MRFSTRTVGDRVNNAVKRVTIESNNDDPLFREHEISLYTQEKQKEIEHFEPYGLTSRVKKPTGDGNNKKKAEALMLFTGGNRSHGALLVVGDRRYRIKGLQEGEVALFDDQGHQVHITRDGIVVSAPSGKKIVSQIMKGETAPTPTTGQGDAKKLGQGAQAGQDSLASLTLTKDSWVVNHPTKIQFTVGSSTVAILPDKITVTAKLIETVGKTNLGLDATGDPVLAVKLINDGPAKNTFAKPP